MSRRTEDTAVRPVLSVKELSARWGVNAKTIREAIHLGQLPAFRVGQRRLLIPLAAAESLESSRANPANGAELCQ